MSNNNRELTGKEKRQIKKLITSLCASYDKEYGCLPLDCDCPMFGICYTKECGKHFSKDGKRIYCSEKCAEEARRRQTAARVRKHREKHS